MYTTTKDTTALMLSGVTVPARWDYSSMDPLAVHLQLHTGPAYVDWQFSRDLLLAGMTADEWVGQGDVRVRRGDEDFVAIYLDVDGQAATLLFRLVDVSQFIARSLLEMPIGDEQIDTDLLATTSMG